MKLEITEAKARLLARLLKDHEGGALGAAPARGPSARRPAVPTYIVRTVDDAPERGGNGDYKPVKAYVVKYEADPVPEGASPPERAVDLKPTDRQVWGVQRRRRGASGRRVRRRAGPAFRDVHPGRRGLRPVRGSGVQRRRLQRRPRQEPDRPGRHAGVGASSTH